MQLDQKQLLECLVGRGIEVDPRSFSQRGRPLHRLLVEEGRVSPEIMLEVLAKVLGLERVTSAGFPTSRVEAGGASLSFLRQSRILPIEESDIQLTLAMADPTDRQALHAMRLLCGKEIVVKLALSTDLDRAFERLYADPVSPRSKLNQQENAGSTEAGEASAIGLLDELLRTALGHGASDLHIEPLKDRLRLRYRIDGKLVELGASPPSYLAEALVGRVKVLGSLNIAERRLPQDGRASVSLSGREIEVRISTVPSINGESVVLRLLDPSSGPKSIDALGLGEETSARFKELLKSPSGMILVTGPTGSGKTTTLHAALSSLNLPERKIIALEDPVEYRIEGISQIQVKPEIGMGFASLLRSVVRQDPDVIMVGEIRDKETAELSVQAALTGHMILSTLHTNDAAGAVTRLMDLGIEPFLITSTVRAVLAQRLVRRLCKDCRTEATLDPMTAERLGLPQSSHVWKANGCASCHRTGYRGRVVVSEFLALEDEHKQTIFAGKSLETSEEGGSRRDGARLVMAGETSAEEILAAL